MESSRRLSSYLIGYGASLLTTLTAYLLVNEHVSSHHERFSHDFLTPLLTVLALVQCVVQLVYFLHLGRERAPRWRLWVFGYMVGMICIIVFGSIWIMNNLNYNMMTPEHLKLFMHQNEGL